MTAFSQKRGWSIYYKDNQWLYSDNNKPINSEERPCKHCGRFPTPEGYDACLGHLPNVTSACCGHGHGGYELTNDAHFTSI